MKSSDRVAVVLKTFNHNGQTLLQEHRVVSLSSLIAIMYSYSMSKPDDCIRINVDIKFPETK